MSFMAKPKVAHPDLPKNARDYVAALERMINAPISVIGVGPGRDESIVVNDLLR